jgi:hypothetical protein
MYVILWHNKVLREYVDETLALSNFKWFNTFLCPRFLEFVIVPDEVFKEGSILIGLEQTALNKQHYVYKVLESKD